MYAQVEARGALSCHSRPNLAEGETTRCDVQWYAYDALGNPFRCSGVARIEPEDVPHHQSARRRLSDLSDAPGSTQGMCHRLLEEDRLACPEQPTRRLLMGGVWNRDDRGVNIPVFADRVHRRKMRNAEMGGHSVGRVAVHVDNGRQLGEWTLGNHPRV